MSKPLYCLDANVLITAWEQYYHPQLCPSYWDALATLGRQNRIFIPEVVYQEIVRTEDDLTAWLRESNVPVRDITEPVTECLQKMYAANPKHQTLVDNIKGRSLADPWVVAHAMHESAVVVTKENRLEAATAKRIRIPNVCDNLKLRCINDFDWVKELGLQFSCHLPNDSH